LTADVVIPFGVHCRAVIAEGGCHRSSIEADPIAHADGGKAAQPRGTPLRQGARPLAGD
jgi:hypothetical protein